jgi:hypothetical protein
VNNFFNSENKDIYTLVLLMVGTFWGVMVKYLAYIRKANKEFKILIFISEYFAHGFVGFVVFLLCKGLGLNENLTLAVSLLGAFIGLKILLKFEDEVLEGMEHISDKIKGWLK